VHFLAPNITGVPHCSLQMASCVGIKLSLGIGYRDTQSSAHQVSGVRNKFQNNEESTLTARQAPKKKGPKAWQKAHHSVKSTASSPDLSSLRKMLSTSKHEADSFLLAHL
jgi:hypothetical protein